MKKDSRIIVFNQDHLIGSGLANILRHKGFKNTSFINAADCDFSDGKKLLKSFKKIKPEYCFLAPVREGGILDNINSPGELIYKNIIFEANCLHAAFLSGVKKLVFFASSCVYPKDCPQPMKEEYLLTGPFEPTNEAYSVAKIAGIKMCQAYNKQYRTNFISVIPATVFGPGDSFDLRNSHVVSALLRKFHEAKLSGFPEVKVWGSGKPRREFVFIDDLANTALFIMKNNTKFDVINLGTGKDHSIKELALVIKEVVGFKGKIVFDKTKPDGVLRKLLDVSISKRLWLKSNTKIDLQLKRTYEWFSENSCHK